MDAQNNGDQNCLSFPMIPQRSRHVYIAIPQTQISQPVRGNVTNKDNDKKKSTPCNLIVTKVIKYDTFLKCALSYACYRS